MQLHNVDVVNHSQYKGIKMLEGIIVFVLGSFVYDNLDFFHTAKNQMRDGYEWELNIKERNPDVPAIPLQYENGKEKVIWVLEK